MPYAKVPGVTVQPELDPDATHDQPLPKPVIGVTTAVRGRWRERVAIVVAYGILFTFPLAVVAITVHARRMRGARELRMPAIVALAARLPSSDLALAGGSRALRSPSLEEPSAAFTDAPASLDQDPAGALMAPPRAVWVDLAKRNQGTQ